MDVYEAIHARRSIKRFTGRRIERSEIERLLDAAVRAPNHRMTEPWAFVVLGEEARERYADIRARLKAARVEDAEAAEAVRAKVREQTRAIPALIAVLVHEAEDPVVREEDYAATWMAVENLALAAVGDGLGTYIHTGRILEDAELQELVRLPGDHRLVAVVDVGEPAEAPAEKERTPAREKTRWLP